MECEGGLITPTFRLMAPSLLINDDMCHTAKTRIVLCQNNMFGFEGIHSDSLLTSEAFV